MSDKKTEWDLGRKFSLYLSSWKKLVMLVLSNFLEEKLKLGISELLHLKLDPNLVEYLELSGGRRRVGEGMGEGCGEGWVRGRRGSLIVGIHPLLLPFTHPSPCHTMYLSLKVHHNLL